MKYLIVSIIVSVGIVIITPSAFAEKLDQLDGTILKSVCEDIVGTVIQTSDIQNAPIELCKFGNRSFKIVHYYSCTENIVNGKDPDTGIVHTFSSGCSVPQSCIPNYAWTPPSRMDHHDKLPIEIEKKFFTIVTDIDDGICTSLAFNTLEKKVSIISKGVWENDTTISVLIPKELMRGEFEVKLDGKKTNSTISDTPDYCTPYVPNCRYWYSKVDIAVGSVIEERKIEITGTQLIPEFPPMKQLANGVLAENIVCKEGLQLIFKSRDNSPACVKPQTAQKLVERGWGTAKTSFSEMQNPMKSIKFTNTEFYMNYSITGGEVLAANFDSEGSVSLSLITTSDGEITTKFPRLQNDTSCDSDTLELFVLADGREIPYEKMISSTERSLTFKFTSGTKEIKIIGQAMCRGMPTLATPFLK